MGKVIITKGGDPIPGVYAVENDIEYTYCDTCGSFSIDVAPHPRTRVEILAAKLWLWVTLLALGWLMIAILLAKDWSLACLFGFAGIAIGCVGVQKTYLRCRTCGNTHITDTNVRNYPGDDSTIIDVSEDLVLKRFIGGRVY